MLTLPTTRKKVPGRETVRTQTAERSLSQAFSSFKHTAALLESFYGQLQVEVGHLRRELERANRDLAQSLEENQRMRSYLGRILQSLPCGVVVLGSDGRLRLANPEARRLLGLAPDAPLEAAGSLPIPLQQFAEDGCFEGAAQEMEWEVPASGETRWVGITRAWLAEDSLYSGEESIFILRDTTVEKQVQRERESVRRTQALAEVSTLLAHEIRNPLGSLELFAGLLAGAVPSGSEERGWVEHLQAGLRGLSATVNNVLQFHSQPSPQLVPTSLTRLLRDAVEFLQPMARQRGCRIQFATRLPEVMIPAEPSRLQQVFLNLAVNAFRAMPSGGCLSLSMKEAETDGRRTIAVSFEDQGKGIAPENLDRIFEPCFTTQSGSPGLGLAVCRKIVEQHGGTISVQSGPGQGTRFTLTFSFPGVPQ